ncbi:MAG: hypothetical protein KKF12_04840 [Proteobacteria bacterium]|nr:hypothetical protein [Desulfobacula sp.]MBU3954219.1 hypothetical protein [Pseudomonadota bacterium]MBU4130125.1 hypothetical protein [Pseudomonadota bacterium]
MDRFNIRSIAVLTIIILIFLTGSALADERILGANDPNWVLNPNCERVVVKVSSVNIALVMSVITVTYKTIEGGVETTRRHPVNFAGRPFMFDLIFSEPGKLVKQIIFDVTKGTMKFEVSYPYAGGPNTM